MHFSTRISIIGTLLAATLSVSATSQGMPPKVQNGHETASRRWHPGIFSQGHPQSATYSCRNA